METISTGTYRHYKGSLYEVIGVAFHSETEEELVIYRALYDSEKFGKNALWARPKSNFIELIETNGKKTPRFVKVK